VPRSVHLGKVRAAASGWRRLWDWGILVILVLLSLRGWLRAGHLASPRLEMVPELGITWMAKQRILEGGLLTEWVPYEFAGFPLVRYLSYPVYDALALSSIFTGIALGWLFKALFISTFIFSAITLYECTYELTQQRGAAVVSGLAYALFPFHLQVGSEVLVHALFWALLPLPFLLYEQSRKARPLHVRHGLYMGLLLGLLPVVNSEHALLIVPFLGVYIILRDGSMLWRHRYHWRSLLGYWTLAGVVALGIAAFFVLPGVIELRYVGIDLKQGSESFQSDDLLRNYVVSPALVLRSIARRLGLDYAFADASVIGHAFWSITWYPGLVALALAGLGVWHKRHDARLRAVLLLLALAVLFVLGSWLPWNPFTHLPFLGRLVAFRGMIFIAFFISICIGWGVAALLGRRWWILSKWSVTVLLASLLFLDYMPATRALTTLPGYLAWDEVAAYRWMQAQGIGYRSWEYTTMHRDTYLRSYALKYDGARHLWGYYDNGAPRHMWALYSWGDLPTALKLGSTRYIIARPGSADFSQQPFAQTYRERVWESEHLITWENPNWQPYVRAYQESVLYLGDPEYRALDVLPALVAQNVALVSGRSDYADDYALGDIAQFDHVIVREPWYRDEIVAAHIENALPGRVTKHREVGQVTPGWGHARSSATITWSRPGPERIQVSVHAGQPVTLVVSEAWYPNWHLYVDGQEQTVWRVNYAFLGARLEAGEHSLIFRYQKPWYVWLGYAITSLTLLAAVGQAVIVRRR